MAKPIRATPELFGEDAKRFLTLMAKNTKNITRLNKKEQNIAKAIESFPL
jgi:hypothetical protein